MPMLQLICHFMPHIRFIFLNIGFHFLSPVKHVLFVIQQVFIRIILQLRTFCPILSKIIYHRITRVSITPGAGISPPVCTKPLSLKNTRTVKKRYGCVLFNILIRHIITQYMYCASWQFYPDKKQHAQPQHKESGKYHRCQV